MRYETRIMEKDEAIAFIQNMRWFAGHGKISCKPLTKNRYIVRASQSSWSMWVPSKKEVKCGRTSNF